MLDIESKLDEDFLFYLGFTSEFAHKMSECDYPRAKQWLQKLCGEPSETIARKRNRNIFLSNLLLDIQERQLKGPFLSNPETIDLDDAAKYFPEVASEVVQPEWIKDVVDSAPVTSGQNRADGRTYVATRVMPGGEGAFAYVAVNMSDEPMWLGGGEGVFDKVMRAKFREHVPPQHEMELILSRRKDAKERQRVITFYEVILQNIADELDGKIAPDENETVNGLLEQLVRDLQQKEQYGPYQTMDERERRVELLLLLFDRANLRKRQTQTREEVLDQIGEELNASFFDSSVVGDEEKYEMPAAMWEYCINRPPGKKAMETLRATYPPFVVEKFLQLMSNTKEDIALNMQRRHVNIISQLKKELKVEGDKMKRKVQEAKDASDRMEGVLKHVRQAYDKQVKSHEDQKQPAGGQTEITHLYEEMKQALKDTQFAVEQEAARGHFLAEQINDVNVNTEMYNQLSERTIMMTEEANMELMKTVKRMYIAVHQYETRLQQMQQMQDIKQQSQQQMYLF